MRHDSVPRPVTRPDGGQASIHTALEAPDALVPAPGSDALTPGGLNQANASLRYEEEARPVVAPVRVIACVLAAACFGAAGLMVLAMARKLIADGHLIDPAGPSYWPVIGLAFVPFLLFAGHRMWRAAWSGVAPENDQVDEIESRALLKAVEQHDRFRAEAGAEKNGDG